ncbi:MAG: pilus assembly protein [Chloroflexota bacterium]|nr:pilus assembly protein [Chloroflexota bacterium]
MNHRQPAVTIVTFALVAPVFMFIIFGTLEMGRVLSAWMVLTNEAREAARYAAVNYNGTADPAVELNRQTTNVRSYVQQRLSGVLAPSGMYRQPDVAFVPSGTNQSPLVQVTLYYQVGLVTPIISQFMPNPFPIAARSAMRGE